MMDSKLHIGSLSRRSKLIALVAGPLFAAIAYFLFPESYVDPSGNTVAFTHAGRACLSVVIWMAIWWFTEAIPIAATALLPIVLFPLLGVVPIAKATAPYASDTIYLFLGGFLLAIGIQRWHLDRRIALRTIAIVGTKPAQISAGMMFATAFLSMWVSNTATAAMMVPIALAVMNVVRATSDRTDPKAHVREHNFAIAVLLAVAYAASIGGMATVIGSPPNGIFVRFVAQTYDLQVSVLDWMTIGLPVMLILLPLTWLLLNKVLFKEQIAEIPGGKEWVRQEIRKLGPISRGEKIVLAVFVLTIALWVFSPQIRGFELADGTRPLKNVSDAGIAMFAGMALFAIPVNFRTGAHVITWEDCRDIPWDVLLLFGGGLSMAAAIQSTGCAGLIGAQATAFAGLPEYVMVLGVAFLVIFATEFTSNTALTAAMLPLLAAAAPSMGISPNVVLLTTAVGASAAFMMPVATPPNAIIFGTGLIRIADMIRAGFWLNIISAFVIGTLCYFLSDLVGLAI